MHCRCSYLSFPSSRLCSIRRVISTLPTLVKDTRAVITTAGPFQKYGSNVVEFCAKYGTHYVDITGESDWVQNMIVQWHETAQKTGAKIVSMCGHDCVPWDLTVMKLEEALPEGEELISVDCLNDMVGRLVRRNCRDNDDGHEWPGNAST